MEKKKIESENTKLGEKHEEITKTRSKSFGKTLTDKNKRLLTQDLTNVQLPISTNGIKPIHSFGCNG